MKKCPECSFDNGDKSATCSRCGYDFTDMNYAQRKKCPKCQTNNNSDNRKCFKCGYVFYKEKKQRRQSRLKKNKGESDTPAYIGAVFVVLFVTLALVGIVFGFSQCSSTQTPKPRSEMTAQEKRQYDNAMQMGEKGYFDIVEEAKKNR